jgi:hypothetical protein
METSVPSDSSAGGVRKLVIQPKKAAIHVRLQPKRKATKVGVEQAQPQHQAQNNDDEEEEGRHKKKQTTLRCACSYDHG